MEEVQNIKMAKYFVQHANLTLSQKDCSVNAVVGGLEGNQLVGTQR